MPIETAPLQQARQRRSVLALLQIVRTAWSRVDPANLDASWEAQKQFVLQQITLYQIQTATGIMAYVPLILAELGLDDDALGILVPEALAGYASDGRSLADLLASPVITVKERIAAGEQMIGALGSGYQTLGRIVKTQLADIARTATSIEITHRPDIGGYVRHVSVPACKRCIILAGNFYRFNSGFLRHPQCDCLMVPTTADMAHDLVTDPEQAVRDGDVSDLSKAEKTAITRDGADIYQVANASRGRTSGLSTTEGATKRGVAGAKLKGRRRLTPQGIYKIAGDRSAAVALLKTHGYIR